MSNPLTDLKHTLEVLLAVNGRRPEGSLLDQVNVPSKPSHSTASWRKPPIRVPSYKIIVLLWSAKTQPGKRGVKRYG